MNFIDRVEGVTSDGALPRSGPKYFKPSDKGSLFLSVLLLAEYQEHLQHRLLSASNHLFRI